MTRAAALLPAVSKEIRALLPLWGASVAALAAVFLWRGNWLLDIGQLAYAGGSIAIGAHSIGHEYTYRTLPMLLSQPADRRRVYLLKFVVSAVMLLTLAAFAWTVLWRPASRPLQFSVMILPVLCGLFLAPLATMIGRSSLAGTMLSASFGGLTWLVTLAIAWFWLGIDVETLERLALRHLTLAAIVLSPVAGLLGWRRFATLEATEVASPALHLPRWLKGSGATRRHSPLRALAAKEIYLQQLTFGVAGFYIVAWAAFLIVQRYVPSLSTVPLSAVMLLYCLGLALVIGALASAEERQLGTLDGQLLQPTPAWQQWMVKVGVAFGLALLLGVGLPILLSVAGRQEEFRPGGLLGDLAVLVVVLTAVSVYISSLSSSGVQAMAWSVPVGVVAVLFTQWVTAMAIDTTQPSDPIHVVGFTARALSLILTPLLLWFGFVNHTSSERTVRRIVQQVASTALVVVMGIVAVSLYFSHPG